MKWILIVLTALVAMTSAASASPGCMSKREARAAFPTRHIYWHGEDHCWDTHPARQARHHRHRAEPEREVRQVPPVPRERPLAAGPSIAQMQIEPTPPSRPAWADVWNDRILGAVQGGSPWR